MLPGPGSFRRNRRVHRCVGQRVGDPGVIRNRDCSDLLGRIGDAVQIVVSVGVFSDRALSAIELKDSDLLVCDDSDVFLFLIPKDRVKERITERRLADSRQGSAAVALTQTLCD